MRRGRGLCDLSTSGAVGAEAGVADSGVSDIVAKYGIPLRPGRDYESTGHNPLLTGGKAAEKLGSAGSNRGRAALQRRVRQRIPAQAFLEQPSIAEIICCAVSSLVPSLAW